MDTSKTEYEQKLAIKADIERLKEKDINEKGLKDFSKIAKYMQGEMEYIDREIIYAHLDFEPITKFIANRERFTIVSGKNPSTSLHLGHLATFNMLLQFQKLGADVIIPLTSDESYVDGKCKSIKDAEKIANEIIIPQIIAIGFDPAKTKILLHTQCGDIYRLAMTYGQYINLGQVYSAFGGNSNTTTSQLFYRGAVQLSTVLLPQIEEFGGPKNVLIPVSADQHPYVLLARDVAKKISLMPPSEVVIPFLQSHRDPYIKMSSSKPDTCIFLNDSTEIVRQKLSRAFTGSVSSIEGHRDYGGVPEIDSCYQILRYHHPSREFVNKIYTEYKSGKLLASELKEITIGFVSDLLSTIQSRVEKVSESEKNRIMLNLKITSI